MLVRFSTKVLCFLLCVVSMAALPNAGSGAVIVNPGFDLLYTVGAQFDFGGAGGLGVEDFKGVSLGTYDFGSGPVNVGATDTILRRLAPAVMSDLPTPDNDTIPIEIVALSLRTVNAIDWSGFGGIANEFVRTVLIADLGSTMTIHNNPFDSVPNPDVFGTFDSNLQFTLQLQGMTSGALSPIIPLNFVQTGATWTRDPSGGNPILINGVNRNLNGIDNSTDFFTGLAHHGPIHIHDTIDVSHAPEPGSFALLGLGFIAAGVIVRRRRHGKVADIPATEVAC